MKTKVHSQIEPLLLVNTHEMVALVVLEPELIYLRANAAYVL